MTLKAQIHYGGTPPVAVEHIQYNMEGVLYCNGKCPMTENMCNTNKYS